VRSLTAAKQSVTNMVRVTVTYQWSPDLFVVGPIYLTSTTQVPMSF
jgi:hypothetical protein